MAAPPPSYFASVGEDYEPRKFGTWAPKGVAAIGASGHDRRPINRNSNAAETPGDGVERFSERLVRERMTILRRKAARWAADDVEALMDANAV